MTLYTGGCLCGAVRYEITAEPVRSFQCQMPRLPEGYRRRTRIGLGVPPGGDADHRRCRRKSKDCRQRCREAQGLLWKLRLAALQQAAKRARPDRGICRHARRSLRIQATNRDVCITGTQLGSSRPDAAEGAVYAAIGFGGEAQAGLLQADFNRYDVRTLIRGSG